MRVLFAAAVLLTGISAAPSQAAPGHVQGTVRGLPAQGARVFAAVRAVDRVTGRVVASTTLRRSKRRYRLKTAPGHYFVAVDALALPGGNVSRMGRSVRVRGRRTARHNVTARATQAARAVVGVDEINLTTAPGLAPETAKLRALAINQAFKAFSRKGIRVVDDSAQVVAAQRVEEKLAREGRSDSTFVAHPLEPTVRLAGGGVIHADGSVSLELKLVRPDGTLVAIKSFGTKPTSFDAFGKFLTDATSSFAAENADAVKTTAAEGLPVAAPDRELGPAPAGSSNVAITAAVDTTDHQPHGVLKVTPPGRTYSELSEAGLVFEGPLPLGSTIRAEATPADGWYFGGWGASCGITGGITENEYDPTWECAVGPPDGRGRFVVTISIGFYKCPPPGTLVIGGGAVTCPGVIRGP